MDPGAPMFPFPVYVGDDLSQCIVVPPRQILSLLARFPSSSPQSRATTSSSSSSHAPLSAISLEFHAYLFSKEGAQSIRSRNQTLLAVDPPISATHDDLSFSLSVTYTGFLQLHTLGKTFSSFPIGMARNSTHKLAVIASAQGVVMVLLNGSPAIHVPDNIAKTRHATKLKDVEGEKTDLTLAKPFWPFGALYFGNGGPSQNNHGEKNYASPKNLCSGALAGLRISPHSNFELESLFRFYPVQSPSVTASSPPPRLRDSMESMEQLGTMTHLVHGPVDAPQHFPPNSSPIPSRISRPLFEIEQLEHWENYLCAFSYLNLLPLRPCERKQRENTFDPLVIHCHDYRGGYYLDCAWESFISPGDPMGPSLNDIGDSTARSSRTPTFSTFVPHVYTFQHWQYIDIFIYFTHERISIPPAATIQAAHMNGVMALGTLICEWDEGRTETLKLLAGKHGDRFYYARKMVEIASKLGFDGWLMNFEHPVSRDTVPELARWVKELRRMSNEQGLIVVWYDSIIETGELKWQSALNEKNRIFFDTCDYFFTDYHWKLPNLDKSIETAGKGNVNRVFIGNDVHGRGTYGGGGWNVPFALKAIMNAKLDSPAASESQTIENVGDPEKSILRGSSSDDNILQSTTSKATNKEGELGEYPGLSIALFAPAWTLESQAVSFDSLHANESLFWEGKETWNIFSESFTGQLTEYYRQYLTSDGKEDNVDFTVADILSPWDGNEEEARKLSKTLANEASGRFPGIASGNPFSPRVTAARWSWRHLKMSIADSKIPLEWIDRQPELGLSVWVKGSGPIFSDLFRLRVLFLDANNACMAEYDSGVLEMEEEWQQLRFTWKEYGAGVRTILWLDGSRDVEGWAGFYGCVIDRPAIFLANPDTKESISTYIQARRPKHGLPFVSSFDLGYGSSLYSSGSPLDFSLPSSQLYWYNLASQSPSPSLQITYESILHFSLNNPTSFRPSPRRSGLTASSSKLGLTPTEPTTEVGEKDSLKSPAELPTPIRTQLSKMSTKMIKVVDARIVDALNIDGGVWHGSSALKISATFSPPPSDATLGSSSPFAPQKPIPLEKSSSGSAALSDSIDQLSSSSSSASAPFIPSLGHKKLRRSSRMNIYSDLVKSALPAEMATIDLYSLSIEAPGESISLNLVYRASLVSANALVVVLVTRRLKETKDVLEPISWDLLSVEHRDASIQSSVGWNQFSASWTCEEGIIYDGVKIGVVALPASLSTSSPRSPRLLSSRSRSNSVSSLDLANAAPHGSLTLIVGFVKIEKKSFADASAAASTDPHDDLPLHLRDQSEGKKRQSAPLALDYQLTWSPKSLHFDVPFYSVVLYWVAPPVPPHLAHLGPPHFIVTATSLSTHSPRVICQDRTFTPSYEIPSVHATHDLLLTVSTVLPDFSQPPNLVQKVHVVWPHSQRSATVTEARELETVVQCSFLVQRYV